MNSGGKRAVSPRKLEISLPDDLAAEVASAVARGEFTSESDAVLGAVVEPASGGDEWCRGASAPLPKIGRERFDIAAGMRSVVSGSYLILYRILGGEVEVVRYVHMRRQLKGLA
jgi:hypothetical protein